MMNSRCQQNGSGFTLGVNLGVNFKRNALIVLMMLLGVMADFVCTTQSAANDPSTQGVWSNVVDAQIVPVHVHLLPTGQVMYWQKTLSLQDQVRLWDPVTQTISTTGELLDNIFCSGHSFTPDGELIVTGGSLSRGGLPNNGKEPPTANLYNPFSNTWTRLPDMSIGRYYPTNTTLPNGDVLVVSGKFIADFVAVDMLPEIWERASGMWRVLTNAQLKLTNYPFMFVAPNGQVFNAGPNKNTGYLDTASHGRWIPVADSNFNRIHGSAVMYDNGKILILGGSSNSNDPPTSTAEIIDLNAAAPTWQFTNPMVYARHFFNTTLLPDGNVLVTGGTSSAKNTATGAVLAAEMWDPLTGIWSTMAAMQLTRLYHTTSLLLPDGRVLVGGGGQPVAPGETDHKDFEIYSPPYLFKGARPTIMDAPLEVAYGQTFFVQTPGTVDITQVNWIRLPSVTHGFDQNQHISHLTFSQAPEGLNVTAPASPNMAPPGHYMMFLLNKEGIPSVAHIIRVASDIPRLLTVIKSGSGAGTVMSLPLGINCGADCAEAYVHNMGVTLTAIPDNGSTFSGWSGPDAVECGTGYVMMTADKSCTATFTNTANPRLTVTKILLPNNDTGRFNLGCRKITSFVILLCPGIWYPSLRAVFV